MPEKAKRGFFVVVVPSGQQESDVITSVRRHLLFLFKRILKRTLDTKKLPFGRQITQRRDQILTNMERVLL
jgi:hypothetical protein